MAPNSRYSPAPWFLILALASGVAACSDDKPAASAQGQQSSGGESFKSRVDSAHEDFKKDIQPAAGWVDDRSHEVADEAVNAVNKGKKKLSGDDEQDSQAASQPQP